MTRVAIPACLICAALGAPGAFAQNAGSYPDKPVKVVSVLAVGGAVDTMGRLVSTKLSENFQRQFLVENRLGGGGTIGYTYVARAPHDGYTLLVAGSGYTIASVIYPVQYDPLKDIVPIAQTSNSYYLLIAHPALPVRSVRDLVALARARPGQLNFGSGGVGSSVHFAMEMFAMAAGIRLTHVPYKGSGQAQVDLVSGELQIMMANAISALTHVKAGRLRALGISSPKRSRVLPEIPTIEESGFAFALSVWTGFFAPAGVSPEIMNKLHAEIGKVLNDPAIVRKVTDSGGEEPETLDQFRQTIQRELVMNRKIAAARNIKAD